MLTMPSIGNPSGDRPARTTAPPPPHAELSSLMQFRDVDPEQYFAERQLSRLLPRSGLRIRGGGNSRRRRFKHLLHDAHDLLHYANVGVASARAVVVAAGRPVEWIAHLDH